MGIVSDINSVTAISMKAPRSPNDSQRFILDSALDLDIESFLTNFINAHRNQGQYDMAFIHLHQVIHCPDQSTDIIRQYEGAPKTQIMLTTLSKFVQGMIRDEDYDVFKATNDPRLGNPLSSQQQGEALISQIDNRLKGYHRLDFIHQFVTERFPDNLDPQKKLAIINVLDQSIGDQYKMPHEEEARSHNLSLLVKTIISLPSTRIPALLKFELLKHTAPVEKNVRLNLQSVALLNHPAQSS